MATTPTRAIADIPKPMTKIQGSEVEPIIASAGAARVPYDLEDTEDMGMRRS